MMRYDEAMDEAFGAWCELRGFTGDEVGTWEQFEYEYESAREDAAIEAAERAHED